MRSSYGARTGRRLRSPSARCTWGTSPSRSLLEDAAVCRSCRPVATLRVLSATPRRRARSSSTVFVPSSAILRILSSKRFPEPSVIGRTFADQTFAVASGWSWILLGPSRIRRAACYFEGYNNSPRSTMPKTRQRKDRAPKLGRPTVKDKRCKLIAYVKPNVLRDAKRAAARTNGMSLSSWAALVLEREARRYSSRPLPEDVYLPGPADPAGLTRQALRDDREGSR